MQSDTITNIENNQIKLKKIQSGLLYHGNEIGHLEIWF